MVRIRAAVGGDAVRLAEILAISWRAAYRGVLSDGFLDGLTPTSRLGWWQQRLARVPPRWSVLVAETPDAVVGFATTGQCSDPDRAESGELFALYLDPACWGDGVGSQLLEGAEAVMRTAGYRDAILWVLADNERARSFYEHRGWVTNGRTKRMIIGAEAVTAVRYGKTLAVTDGPAP